MNVEQVTLDINTLSERVGRHIERFSIDHENLTNIILDVIRDLMAECAFLRKERDEARATIDCQRGCANDKIAEIEKERDFLRLERNRLRLEFDMVSYNLKAAEAAAKTAIRREDIFRIYNELMKKLENLVGKD